MAATCSVDGCGRGIFAQQWCKPHWSRWRRTGDVRATEPIRVPIRGGPDAQFWAKVDKSGSCWLWTGTRNAGGYGQWTEVAAGRRLWKAHRRSWVLHFGPIPDGLHVCHHCDVPSCVRPDHLFLGTPLHNARDKISKGRAFYGPPRHGEANGHAVLVEDQVRAIRDRAAAGETQAALAREYGMSRSAVNAIVKRRNWSHIA